MLQKRNIHREYFHYWQSEYGDEPDAIRRELIFPLLRGRLKKTFSGKSILDAGCGNGNLISELESWSPKKYLGIDVNAYFVSRAAMLYSAKFDFDVRYFNLDLDSEDWPLKISERFDLVLSIFTFNEFQHPLRFLNACRGLLSRGGRLVLVMPHPFSVVFDIDRVKTAGLNRPKYPGANTYFRPQRVPYRFSRGDFERNVIMFPVGELFTLFSRAELRVDWTEELPSALPSVSDDASRASSHIPSFLVVSLAKDAIRRRSKGG